MVSNDASSVQIKSFPWKTPNGTYLSIVVTCIEELPDAGLIIDPQSHGADALTLMLFVSVELDVPVELGVDVELGVPVMVVDLVPVDVDVLLEVCVGVEQGHDSQPLVIPCISGKNGSEV